MKTSKSKKVLASKPQNKKAKRKQIAKKRFAGVKEEKLYSAIYRLSNEDAKHTISKLWEDYKFLRNGKKRKTPAKKTAKNNKPKKAIKNKKTKRKN